MLDSSRAQVSVDLEDQGLDILHYYQLVKKRILYALIPFVCVFAIGFAAAMLWPPTFLSEGKILVEAQQIPVDLVRPTVTSPASERLVTIEQRVMTRNNLLKIADKYNLFADRRDRLSRTDILDLMRENTVIKPVDVDQLRSPNTNFTVAINIGYMDRRPDVATKVANELITLFLDEDARTRTNRATETTKFLGQEVDKLKSELAAIDAKIIASQQQPADTILPQASLPQLTALRAELAEKSAIYSPTHPEIVRLKAQIKALEEVKVPVTHIPVSPQNGLLQGTTGTQFLDPLFLQRLSVQQNLESTSQKLAAAQRGENLERDQYSERLQVLEQAVPPQKPIKPNRRKIIAFAFLAAVAAGFGGIMAIESIDKTIRGSKDLLSVANGQLDRCNSLYRHKSRALA